MIFHVSCLKLLLPSNQPQVLPTFYAFVDFVNFVGCIHRVDGEQIQAMKREPLVVWGDIGDENPTQLNGDYFINLYNDPY